MKMLAKVVHFFKGVELMGSRGSATASMNIEIEVTPFGPKITSKGSKRTVLVPWANITGIELYYEEPVGEPVTAEPLAPKRGRPAKVTE